MEKNRRNEVAFLLDLADVGLSNNRRHSTANDVGGLVLAAASNLMVGATETAIAQTEEAFNNCKVALCDKSPTKEEISAYVSELAKIWKTASTPVFK